MLNRLVQGVKSNTRVFARKFHEGRKLKAGGQHNMARESKTNSYIMPKHEKMDYTPLAKLSRPTQSSAGAIVSKFVYANVISSTSTYVTAQVAAAIVGWYAFTEFGDALWADFNDGCSYDDIIAKYPNLPPGLGDDDDDDDEDDEDDEDEDDE